MLPGNSGIFVKLCFQIIFSKRIHSSESLNENEETIEASLVGETLNEEEPEDIETQDDEIVQERQIPTMETVSQASSSKSNMENEDTASPAESQLSEPVNRNNNDSNHANAKHYTSTGTHQTEINTEFVETKTLSDSNDSVLDNSTDGEESNNKEVFIDYTSSLTRKGSQSSEMSETSSVDRDSMQGSFDSGLPTRDAIILSKYLVVAAIDFGTTYSGYAFAFTRDPESIHMMRRWEGGDPGVSNTKTPTTLLLTPDKHFHSFGFGARDFYHDLEPAEAKKYLYFEKFKMKLYDDEV